MKDVHICPIQMRTVIWIDGECTEKCEENNCPIQVLTMKGATMLETLYKLGISPSNSRPRVSNDNPYSESMFKTLKYRPNYQPKGFATIEEAREWCAAFVRWCRTVHHQSGISFLTPSEVHAGKAEDLLRNRRKIYEDAKAAHPERWNGRDTRSWVLRKEVWLNPPQGSEKLSASEKPEGPESPAA